MSTKNITDNVFRPSEDNPQYSDNVFRLSEDNPQYELFKGIVNTGKNSAVIDDAVENLINVLDPLTADENSSYEEILDAATVYGPSQTGDIQALGESYDAVKAINDDSLINNVDKQNIYRDAISGLIGIPESDYDKYFQKPDQALPYMVAGASLKQSDRRGESIGSALLKAYLNYRGAKRQGAREYDKQIKDYELSKKKLIDQYLMNIAIDDERTKNDIANAYLKDRYFEEPKFYMISNAKGEFVNPPKVMSDLEVTRFREANPKITVRPYDKTEDDLKNYTIKYKEKDGTTSEVSGLMTTQAVRNYLPINSGGLGKYDNVLSVEEGAGNTNLKNYLITYTDGREPEQISLNPDQYNAYNKEKEIRGIKNISQLTGGFSWAIDNRGESPVIRYVSNGELAGAAGGDFSPKPGMNVEVTKDGVVMSDGNPNSMLTAKYKDGRKKGEEIREKINITETLVDNYFTSANQVDELLSEFEGNKDLIMNNLTAQGATFGDKVITNINALGDLFRSPVQDGGYTFKVGDQTVSYSDFQSSILDSPEWQTFSRGPLGQTLKDIGVTGQAYNAALFDLAMIAASTYGNKESLDMRALSDKDVAFFLKTQGNEAYSFDGYLKIIGGFRKRLLERNINVLEKYLEDPDYFYDGIINQNGGDDIKYQEVTNNRIRTILGIDKEGNKTGKGFYAMLENTDELTAPNAVKVLKQSGDETPTDVNEVDLTTLVLDPANQSVIQAFNSPAYTSLFGGPVAPSKVYTQATTLRNGGSIEALVKGYLLTKPGSQERELYNNRMLKQLTPEEYIAYDIYKSLAVREQ